MEQLNQNQINAINYLKNGGANALFGLFGKPAEDDCKKTLSSIPRFKEEYSGDFICLYAGFEVSHFDPNEQNLCLYLFSEENNKGDWYRLSTSVTFDAKNNRLPLEKTVETLKKVIDIQGTVINWNEILKALMCRKFPAWVTEKETSKGVKFFAIVSIGSNFEIPKALPIPASVDLGAILKGMSLPNAADIPFVPPQSSPFPSMPAATPQQAAPQPQQAQPMQQPQASPFGGNNPFGNV